MTRSFTGRKRIRRHFGRIPEITQMPNLIEVQKTSYDQFLQMVETPDERQHNGDRHVVVDEGAVNGDAVDAHFAVLAVAAALPAVAVAPAPAAPGAALAAGPAPVVLGRWGSRTNPGSYPGLFLDPPEEAGLHIAQDLEFGVVFVHAQPIEGQFLGFVD